MPSPSEEFLTYLQGEVDRYENLYGVSRGRAFMLWYAIEALRIDEDAALEAVSYDGSNDKFIDLFFVDEEAERVIIAQGKYDSRGRYRAKVGDLLTVYHTTDWLSQPEALVREGRPDLAEAGRAYLTALANGFSIEYQLVYAGPKSTDVTSQAVLLNTQDQGNTPSKTTRPIYLQSLLQAHDEFIDKDTRIYRETITLAAPETFERPGTFGKALVVTLSGTELHRLYEKHGDSLFDRNVRLFLGARKGGVNAGIRDTLSSETERKNFWAYNNGITFVCDRYETQPGESTVTLHNFSIVNGCQTTVSVGTANPEAAKDASVLARIIASSRSPMVDSIIRYTNSQTPIRSWDITSQDRAQKALKQSLAKGPFPFHYELRRGEAKSLAPKEKARLTRDRELQTIEYDILAQYLGAFNGIPSVAYASKRLLFTAHRDTVFPGDLSAEKTILCWQAGKAATDVVRQYLTQPATLDREQSAKILRRGGKLYVLAVMSVLLSQRNGPTYIERLPREKAGSKATRSRVEGYAKLALLWYLNAMKELLEAGGELSLLLRSQESFAKIKAKILFYWGTFSADEAWVEGALDKL